MTKRGIDVVVASAGLVVLSPVLASIAIAVKSDSPGPVFYRAVRVGRDGRAFTMFKFRTMYVGADRGPGITGATDTRITNVGRRLRATHLDELPQLINVIVGEMSLVGPRPEAPHFVRYYSAEQLEVLRVRPGITGPTQLQFRDEAKMLSEAEVEQQYVRDVLSAKLASDLSYVRHRTLLSDLTVLATTVRIILAKAKPGAAVSA